MDQSGIVAELMDQSVSWWLETAAMLVLWWESNTKTGKITVHDYPFVPVLVSEPFVSPRPEKIHNYCVKLLH